MGTKYIVENTIYVTVRDLQNLGRMLDAVVSSGANSINGIQFDVVDKSIATSETQRLAAEDAKTQAQELAEAADVELGRILSLNAYSMGSPVQVFEAKVFQGQGGGNVPVAAGQLVLSMDANIVYEIE